jgi:hypothetical protein
MRGKLTATWGDGKNVSGSHQAGRRTRARGLMVVPFASASIMVTLFPDTPRFLGSFTGALSAVKVGIRILLGVSFGRIPGEATMARARRVGARVG